MKLADLSKVRFLSMFLKQKVQHIGLDLGSQSIKVVQIAGEQNDQDQPVVRYGIAALTPGAYMDGVLQKPEQVINGLTRLIEEVGLTNKATVNLSMSGKQVIVRQLKMPQMPVEELVQAVRFEAEKYIAIPLDQLFLDFTILDEVSLEGTPGFNILVAAAPQKMVYNLCQVIQQAGLNPMAIDVEPLALFRFWRKSYFDRELANQAIVNIGHSNSHLVIFKGDSIQFSRIIPMAGSQLTEAINQIIGKEVAAAEENKHSQKIIHLGRYRSEAAVYNEEEENVQQAITEAVSGLTSEIQRSIDFYQMQTKVRLDRLIITGGTANLQGLDTYLEAELGLPVLVGAYDGMDPIYSLATGLALREFMQI